MRPIGKLFIPLAIAFALLFVLNISGLGQATAPNPGTATNPGTGLPAQNPGQTSIQPNIGTATPNTIPEQPPNTTTPNAATPNATAPNSTVIFTPNPNFTPNSNVTPNSTLPNQNPNLVPNPYPPIVTPGTQPTNAIGAPAPVGTTAPGTGSSSPIGAGVPGASAPLSCSGLQPWQCVQAP